MSERRQHTELWAERLQQVSLPDSGKAWQDMEALLDREMPVVRKTEWRRWTLLILLLLLLIGVCHCPGRGRWFGGTTKQISSPGAKGSVTPAEGAATPGTEGAETPGTKGAVPPGTEDPGIPGRKGRPVPGAAVDADVPTAPSETSPTGKGGAVPEENGMNRRIGTDRNVIRTGENREKENSDPDKRKGSRRIRKPGQDGDVVVTGQHSIKKGTHGDSMATKPAIPNIPKDSVQRKSVNDSLRKKPVNDSTRKKPATPAKPEKEKEDIRGFVAGLGLNQFFPVGGQQVSSFNSGGTTGTLSDYIPVPMIRYYFSKKLYVQMEAQFNAPQYAKKNLVIQATPTSLGPNRLLINTVSVQKLFYFNLPLSVHFSPMKNLSIGAGLQYSRLRNAVGQIDSTITNTFSTRVDSVIGKHTITLKTSTAYQLISTNEFRILLDANYTYKHFVLGFRYNQALSNFVNVQLGTGTVTQARNSSLQLYLRYILWDHRKKK